MRSQAPRIVIPSRSSSRRCDKDPRTARNGVRVPPERMRQSSQNPPVNAAEDRMPLSTWRNRIIRTPSPGCLARWPVTFMGSTPMDW
jgi:hypothetical protein